MDIPTLFPEAISHNQPSVLKDVNDISKDQTKVKTFASIVAENVCDIPVSQFSIPCFKGDRLAIVIPEGEYKLGVEACKHHLHGRVI